MSLIDYSKVPDQSADRLAQLRTAMLDLTGDDVIAFANDGSGLNGVDIDPPEEPRARSGASEFAKSFFKAGADMDAHLSAKNEHAQKFDQDADFRKAVALNVLQTLNGEQAGTVENFWKTRDLALEHMRDDVFSARDSEHQQQQTNIFEIDGFQRRNQPDLH